MKCTLRHKGNIAVQGKCWMIFEKRCVKCFAINKGKMYTDLLAAICVQKVLCLTISSSLVLRRSDFRKKHNSCVHFPFKNIQIFIVTCQMHIYSPIRRTFAFMSCNYVTNYLSTCFDPFCVRFCGILFTQDDHCVSTEHKYK